MEILHDIFFVDVNRPEINFLLKKKGIDFYVCTLSKPSIIIKIGIDINWIASDRNVSSVDLSFSPVFEDFISFESWRKTTF